MKHIAVIYDKDGVYAEKLAEYFNASDMFPFETRAFGDIKEMKVFCANNDVEILLIEEESKDKICVSGYKEVICLSTHSQKEDEYYCIYKYQEAEKIIRLVMMYLSKSENLGAVITRKTTMKIISFYSPVKRTLSTTMSLGMGQILGKDHRTLYINLESYSGLSKLIGRDFSKDITDLMYYLESRGGNIGTLISGIVEHVEGLDILPPVHNQQDLISVSIEKWKELIDRIEQDTDYEYVIIDLSEAIQGLYEILDISNCVVSCVENDEVAISKIVQYEESLKDMGYEKILEKTQKCNVPHHHRRNGEMCNLTTGDLGEYIVNVLKGIIDEP